MRAAALPYRGRIRLCVTAVHLSVRPSVSLVYPPFTGQEAQLSQRDRAMIRVTEYFVNSLKVTQGHSNVILEEGISPH